MLLASAPERRYARAYARWRCGGNLPLYKGCPKDQTGRGKLDPVYVEETQGRDAKQWWDKYSSCGDLSQGFAHHLGVRTPYINRAPTWLPGRNLLHFYDGQQGAGIASPNAYPMLHAHVKEHGPPAIRPPAGYVPLPGDLGFVWTPGQNNAHTFVFGDLLSYTGGTVPETAPTLVAETFNYGAGGMCRTEYPGAHCVKSVIVRKPSGLWIGARKLQYVVPLERLLADVEEDQRPLFTGEAIEELEARVP